MSLSESALRHAGAGHALQPSSCLRLTGSCSLGVTCACSAPLRNGNPALSTFSSEDACNFAKQLL